MTFTPPSELQICLSIFACENPHEWINTTSGEKMDARAFDWNTLEPIPVGQERMHEKKEFIYSYCGESFVHPLFPKGGWKLMAGYVERVTGIPTDPTEFEQKITELYTEAGAKRVILLKRSNSLGRKDMANDKLIFRFEPGIKVDYQAGWNLRIQSKGGKWLVNTAGIFITKVLSTEGQS